VPKMLYTPKPCVITEVIPQTYDTNTYVMEFVDEKDNAEFSCYLGQFNMLSVLGIGEAPISISSGPGDRGVFHHTVRNVGNVTGALAKMRPGSTIHVRGPYGRGWPMDALQGKDVLIVAGGIGLAPLRPVLKAISHDPRRFGNVEVLYGARSPKDLLFVPEYDDWRYYMNLHVSVDTLDGTPPGKYHVGVVTTLFSKMTITPKNSVVLMCGPEVMMRFAVRDLLERGFEGDKMYVSLERRMHCGVSKCGRCQIGPKFVCKDGPVFTYNEITSLVEPALGGMVR
jgi:sulfhydrogenase subunit gamma (sulfur reductase)